MVRKAKILKKPKFDLTKLMELYKDKPEAEKAAVAGEATGNIINEWGVVSVSTYSIINQFQT